MAAAGTDHAAGNSAVSLAWTYIPGRKNPFSFGKSISVRRVRDPGSNDHEVRTTNPVCYGPSTT